MHEANLYAKSLDGVNKVWKRTSYVHATKEGFIQLVTWAIIAGTMYYAIYVMPLIWAILSNVTKADDKR
jgi:hypothetical protein